MGRATKFCQPKRQTHDVSAFGLVLPRSIRLSRPGRVGRHRHRRGPAVSSTALLRSRDTPRPPISRVLLPILPRRSHISPLLPPATVRGLSLPLVSDVIRVIMHGAQGTSTTSSSSISFGTVYMQSRKIWQYLVID